MNEFTLALNTAVATSTAMLAKLGTQGVKILLATLAVAVVVIFIRIGFRNGLNAMQGKTNLDSWNGRYTALRKAGYDEDVAADMAFDVGQSIDGGTYDRKKWKL